MRAPLTPIKAFVHDAERGSTSGTAGEHGDERVGHWLTIAQAAERVAALTPGQRLLYAGTLATSVLPPKSGRPTQIEGDGREPSDAHTRLAERFRLEAEDMELAGCFELALVTVSAVCRMLDDSRISERLLATAHMGRVMRQMGDLDNAVGCYSTVVNDGNARGDGAVAAHGFIGLGNVAHERGNVPSQKHNFEQALALAPPGSTAELSAHTGLMLVATTQRQLGDALIHGWRAHDLSPPNSDAQFRAVINMARIADEAGFPDAAEAGFEFVLATAARTLVRMPAIIGALRLVTHFRDSTRLLRLVEIGRVEVRRGATKFDAARFLLCCAEGFHAVGNVANRDLFGVEAQELADTFGYHEIRMRLDDLLHARFTEATPLVEDGPRNDFRLDDSDARVVTGIARLKSLAAV